MWPFSSSSSKIDPQAQQARQLRAAAKELNYDIAQMNYFYDYISEIKSWSTHISNTRRYIVECANRCSNRDTCVVLGSGYCFDVPVLELSRMFKKVYLMDMMHPSKVQQKMREFKNVEFITEDVTKIVIETANSINRYKDFAVDLLMSSPNYSMGNMCDKLGDYSMVVSVNLLSFLAKPIIQYLSRVKLIDDIAEHQLEAFVHRYHINMLPKGKSCIVSPISKRLYNADGLQMYDHSVVYIPKEEIHEPESWQWIFSNAGTGRVEYGVKAWQR